MAVVRTHRIVEVSRYCPFPRLDGAIERHDVELAEMDLFSRVMSLFPTLVISSEMSRIGSHHRILTSPTESKSVVVMLEFADQ
jgi:hypothetical protein